MQCINACALILAWFSYHPIYDTAHRAAIMQQMWTESRFEPCAINKRSGSSYLHQWVGSRKSALHRFAGTAGCPSVEAQMDWMHYELLHNDRYKAFFAAPAGKAFNVLRQRYGYGR